MMNEHVPKKLENYFSELGITNILKKEQFHSDPRWL